MTNASLQQKIRFQVANPDLLARVAGRLTNELDSVTRVLFALAVDGVASLRDRPVI